MVSGHGRIGAHSAAHADPWRLGPFHRSCTAVHGLPDPVDSGQERVKRLTGHPWSNPAEIPLAPYAHPSPFAITQRTMPRPFSERGVARHARQAPLRCSIIAASVHELVIVCHLRPEATTMADGAGMRVRIRAPTGMTRFLHPTPCSCLKDGRARQRGHRETEREW